MSKRSQTKSRQERLKKKRAKKAAMTARYQKYAESGKNTKSKRFQSRKKKTISNKDHPNGPCGNLACTKCHGIKYDSFLKNGKPYRMPQKMWLKWIEKNG